MRLIVLLLAVTTTALRLVPPWTLRSSRLPRLEPPVCQVRTLDIEAALRTLKEAGVSSELLTSVRAELDLVSGRVMPTAVTSTSKSDEGEEGVLDVMLTAIFGPPKTKEQKTKAEGEKQVPSPESASAQMVELSSSCEKRGEVYRWMR